MTTDVLVLGLGNPLRTDDGIGPRVVELLRQGGLPVGTEALDVGAPGFDLLDLLGEPRAAQCRCSSGIDGDGPGRVIIVDAADVGLEAGQFARFAPDQVQLMSAAEVLPSHQAGLAEVLALARAMECPLPEIVIFGVQPRSLDWGEGLTAEVEAALPLLAEAVLREVGDMKTHHASQGRLQV